MTILHPKITGFVTDFETNFVSRPPLRHALPCLLLLDWVIAGAAVGASQGGLRNFCCCRKIANFVARIFTIRNNFQIHQEEPFARRFIEYNYIYIILYIYI